MLNILQNFANWNAKRYDIPSIMNDQLMIIHNFASVWKSSLHHGKLSHCQLLYWTLFKSECVSSGVIEKKL